MPMKSIPKQHDWLRELDSGGQLCPLPAYSLADGSLGKDTMPDGDGRAGGGRRTAAKKGKSKGKKNSDALPMMYAWDEMDTPCTAWFSDRLCVKTLLYTGNCTCDACMLS